MNGWTSGGAIYPSCSRKILLHENHLYLWKSIECAEVQHENYIIIYFSKSVWWILFQAKIFAYPNLLFKIHSLMSNYFSNYTVSHKLHSQLRWIHFFLLQTNSFVPKMQILTQIIQIPYYLVSTIIRIEYRYDIDADQIRWRWTKNSK